MTVAIVFKNRIPALLSKMKVSIADLQRKTGLSYPGVHSLASKKFGEISPRTELGTLQSIADALGVSVNDLFTIEDIED